MMIIEIILNLIPPGLLIWIPVLIVIGNLVKHGTDFPNDYIAVVLFGIAMVVSIVYGIGATEGMIAPFRVVEILLAYGLGYGFLLSTSAVFLYDAVHGALRHRKAKKDEKETAEAERATVSAAKNKETKMAEAVKKEDKGAKKRKFRMTSFLTYLLVVIGSVVLGTLMALPWGIGSALDFISKAIFLAVIMAMAADAAFKIRFEKWKLLWQYWVGLALILGADWCFFWASMTTTWGMMALALGFVALFGASAAVIFWVVYRKKVQEKENAYLAEYEKALVDKGVDATTAAEVATAAKED